ncbi:hypothetical protein [Thalassospira mesophila]|uniref:hypothetical protein n=1 Tax=Thalassospira mesophila TaxID=1293891 RepID=UPI000A1EB32A|nr:hypothetical protein [Thalassospira mesophila]
MVRREQKPVNRRGEKPVYQPFGKGVEAAGLTRDLHDDMKLETRRKNSKKAAKAEKKDRAKAKRARGESWFSRGPLVRAFLTLLLFGGALHGLFVAFGIYDRNQTLSNGAQFLLVIKLLVFVTLMHLFYLMLMHYRPIRHKVRGLFFMALAPVAAVCIFMIYGGAGMFGSFLPILQFLTLTIGVGGFILYVVAYTWLSGKSVRRGYHITPNGDWPGRGGADGSGVSGGRSGGMSGGKSADRASRRGGKAVASAAAKSGSDDANRPGCTNRRMASYPPVNGPRKGIEIPEI